MLHLHAVFPIPDIVWGLVHMDTERNTTITGQLLLWALDLVDIKGCVFLYMLHIQGQILFAKWRHFGWSSQVQMPVWGLKPGFKVKVRTGFRSGVMEKGLENVLTIVQRCACVSHIPSVLSAQPHRALIGFWVNAKEVLQTGPSERTPGGAAHGPAIHRAVCMNAVSSTHPQHPRSSIGAGDWELLLLLTTGGLSYHVFGALTFIICFGRKYECVCVCVSPASVCLFIHFDVLP